MSSRFRMVIALAIWLAAAASVIAATPAPPPTLLRCGWFINPTPANVWLHDRDGEWIIGVQGAHQARGDWPNFKDQEWVRFGNGSYGYGCACLRVQANNSTREITRIHAATVRPLAACRGDPAIKGTEPRP